MTEPNVELIFGVNAGVVWESLNQNGPSTIGDLVKATSLRREYSLWCSRMAGSREQDRRGKARTGNGILIKRGRSTFGSI